MPGVILGVVVVLLSLVQMAICPPANQPACAGPTVSAIVFGALGLAMIALYALIIANVIAGQGR